MRRLLLVAVISLGFTSVATPAGAVGGGVHTHKRCWHHAKVVACKHAAWRFDSQG